jgi:hypothetical protein
VSEFKTFHSLAGIPVHYDRPPVADYGSQGKDHDFEATQGFIDKLEKCFRIYVKSRPYKVGVFLPTIGT